MPGTLLHERAEVPLDRRLDLPPRQEPSGEGNPVAKVAPGIAHLRRKPQVGGHQPAVALLVLHAEVMFHFRLIWLQRADQHVGLDLRFLTEREPPRVADFLRLGR